MEEDKTTEWALLFPLKASLFTMRASTPKRDKAKAPAKENITKDRLQMRRGSSMSELDKLTGGGGTLPDLVRSTTATNRLSSGQTGGRGYDSLPHSPRLSRGAALDQASSCSVRGSIGDLMNQKKYGSSSWSLRSDTLIARTVPLSTVTPRHSPPARHESYSPDHLEVPHTFEPNYPLTAAQRTQKLSRLIKQQRSTLEYVPLRSVSK